MRNTKSHIHINHTASATTINRQRGLFQGSSLSPLLFNVFIEGLNQRLSNNNKKAYMFADDVVIAAKSQQEVQEALDICSQWTDDTSSTWNAANSGYQSHQQGSISINNQAIPNTPSYKYLGFPMKSNGIDWLAHQMTNVQKARRALYLAMASCSRLNPKARTTIFKTFVSSQFQYGLPLIITWSKSQNDPEAAIDPLKKLYKEALNWIGLGHKGCQQIIESVIGLGSFDTIAELSTIGVKKHLQRLHIQNPLHQVINSTTANHVLNGQRRMLYNLSRPPDGININSSWSKIKSTIFYRNNNNDRKLNSYILPEARTINTLMDKSLSTTMWENAFSWRINRFGINQQCHNNHPFNRKCAFDCFQDSILQLYLPDDIDQQIA